MLIIPYLPDAAGPTIEIGGVTYRPPQVDSAGRLRVGGAAGDGGETKGAYWITGLTSTVRATVITPTTNKKIRIIACMVRSASTTGTGFEVYFGTGVSIATSLTKAIMETYLDVDVFPSFGLVWPDGAGPAGASNEVVSLRTTVNIGTSGRIVIHYREE